MKTHVLETRDLAFAYPGGSRVIDGVSARFGSNERVALQAPSGFGKSTFCQLLAGYLEPDAGAVLLDGKPLRDWAGPCPVQLVWQHPEQVMDPYLRIARSLEEAGPIDDGLIARLGIRREWLTRFPHELSGGELQRCCVARTLALRPRFLIADEISTMLDAITQAQIWAFLLNYCTRNKVGLVMVTHSDALRRQLATRTITRG